MKSMIHIGRISPRPLLMINGADDSDMIRESAVEPLFRRQTTQADHLDRR